MLKIAEIQEKIDWCNMEIDTNLEKLQKNLLDYSVERTERTFSWVESAYQRLGESQRRLEKLELEKEFVKKYCN